MNNYKLITKQNLHSFFDALQPKNTIIAPKEINKKYYFKPVDKFEDIALDYIQTVLSAKSVLFPRSDTLFNYHRADGDYNIDEPSPIEKNTIVFGMKPCDASSFVYLSNFFLKDYQDKNIKERLEKLYIISLSCKEADNACFCTSVGSNPASTKGSDLNLTLIENDTYYVEVITEKGQELINYSADLFQDTKEIDKSKYIANVPQKFDVEKAKQNIDSIFESPLWVKDSLACLGCGICAYACPTCTCFDIQDIGSQFNGSRVRNWDSCAFDLFTKHASGHNPRPVQSQRWRNRIKHKFEYSVENLGLISCVGCGRCIRSCPTSMNIVKTVQILQGV